MNGRQENKPTNNDKKSLVLLYESTLATKRQNVTVIVDTGYLKHNLGHTLELGHQEMLYCIEEQASPGHEGLHDSPQLGKDCVVCSLLSVL